MKSKCSLRRLGGKECARAADRGSAAGWGVAFPKRQREGTSGKIPQKKSAHSEKVLLCLRGGGRDAGRKYAQR